MTDNRLDALKAWVESHIGHQHWRLSPASADASFRRYFRVQWNDHSRIIMDAPPEFERCQPFIQISRQFRSLGLNVPEILEADVDHGFVLLSDLGTEQYLDQLPARGDALYRDAFDALFKLQSAPPLQLPEYSQAKLYQEVGLFDDWFFQQYLNLQLTDNVRAMIQPVYDAVVANALEQPRVSIHRDYHSRNLMVTGTDNPGILDFQDAVIGPVTYDPVSLLRDCYICWPMEKIYEWLEPYRLRLTEAGMLNGVSRDQFEYWFDLMGMQRHLKCVGIFARLNIRDGKSGYLKDIPRTFQYILDVMQRHNLFLPFQTFCHEVIMPRLTQIGG